MNRIPNIITRGFRDTHRLPSLHTRKRLQLSPEAQLVKNKVMCDLDKKSDACRRAILDLGFSDNYEIENIVKQEKKELGIDKITEEVFENLIKKTKHMNDVTGKEINIEKMLRESSRNLFLDDGEKDGE